MKANDFKTIFPFKEDQDYWDSGSFPNLIKKVELPLDFNTFDSLHITPFEIMPDGKERAYMSISLGKGRYNKKSKIELYVSITPPVPNHEKSRQLHALTDAFWKRGATTEDSDGQKFREEILDYCKKENISVYEYTSLQADENDPARKPIRSKTYPPVIIQNVGSVDYFREGRQELNTPRVVAEIKNCILGDYFDQGKHFHFVDKRFNEWFDPIVPFSQEITFQEYYVENDILTNREKECPVPKYYDHPHAYESRRVMNQGEFLSFIQNEGIYLEFTIAQVAHYLGFPGFSSYELSSYGHNDSLLIRKKNGDLAWMVFNMTEEELYEHAADNYRLYLYDFEPNAGLPSDCVFLKNSSELFVKTIK